MQNKTLPLRWLSSNPHAPKFFHQASNAIYLSSNLHIGFLQYVCLSLIYRRFKTQSQVIRPSAYKWYSHLTMNIYFKLNEDGHGILTWSLKEGFSLTQSLNHLIVKGNEGITALEERHLLEGLPLEPFS